jgi:lipid-binding SYLF domain-containing protein
MTTRATLIAAMLAASAFVGPAVADVVGVSRCDEAVDGVFRPGLLTVEADGTRTFHPVGENGLTETIAFNRTRAFEWVEAQGFYPAGTMFADLVPEAGLEPASLAAADFESAASTNSATRAHALC